MSGNSQFQLLKTERFLPLFITQALSAFVDNAFRFAVAALVVSTLGATDAIGTNALSAALFTLPFFLFSATAGKLADKFDKAMLARRIKLVEVALIILSIFALFHPSIPFKQFCIFLAGAQSAIFGPVKYGLLPQHLEKEELIGGNGMIEMSTFLAILLGTIFGSLIVSLGDNGHLFIGGVMLASAIGMYWAACKIPPAPPPMPDLDVRKNFLADTWESMKLAREKPVVFQAIMGISWFWLLGVVLITHMQAYTAGYLHGTPIVASQILAIFSIGIAAGSVYCNKLLNGKITAKYVPIAALAMSVFMVDLYFASGSVDRAVSAAISSGATPTETSAAGEKLINGWSALGFWQVWRTYFDFFAIAFFAGLFVVPLFAIMQSRTPYYMRARMVGSNNIYNALFMVLVTMIVVFLSESGVSIRTQFLLLGIANFFAALYIIRILPHDTLARVARFFFGMFYDVEVKGLENYEAAGRKALIVANHTSMLDGPLLSAYLPERAAFAIDTAMSKKWWVKPAFALVDLAPMDPGNAHSLRSLVKALKSGKKVMIFPEGRLTTTGSMMKIYDGPGAIADMAGGKILPVRIDGAQYTPFTRLKGLVPQKLFPKITLTFLPPLKMEAPNGLKGGALREHQAAKLYDVMTEMMFQTSNIDQTLWQGLLEARALHGGKKIVFEDIQRQPMNYNRLILGSFILGRKIAALAPGQKYVGVLMPNANGAIAAIFGLYAFGKVPAMLNFSTGAVNMSAACTAAEVRTILTSRKFIEAAEMKETIKVLGQTNKIVYLEDVRETIGPVDKVVGLFRRTFAGLGLRQTGASRDPNSPAVVLFTSGSEGLPKGVVLSHRNLNANRQQINTKIPFNRNDIFFTALPIFHAFGFTGGIVLPAINGMRAFLYPSPLHYKIVPELIYDTGATVFFATDTFLQGYAKNAHPYDFHTVRLLVGGAERVKPETRAMYSDKYGLRIIEGYGATECSPILSANTFMQAKNGTVGRLVPGIEMKLEPVPGIETGGRLLVKGPNIMLGYLRADNPGVIEPPQDGWYDTGDIVSVDDEGYISIQGRAKRFAKLAGEMVSLTAVEMRLGELYPDFSHAVVAAPDKKKGEQLVMYTTMPDPDRKVIAAGLKDKGLTELAIPKTILHLETLPVLGSGKTDYVSLNRMALDQVKDQS